MNIMPSDSSFGYVYKPDDSKKKVEEAEKLQEGEEISPEDLVTPLFLRIPKPTSNKSSSDKSSNSELSEHKVKLLSEPVRDKGKEKEEDGPFLPRSPQSANIQTSTLEEELQKLSLKATDSFQTGVAENFPSVSEEEVIIEEPDNEILKKAKEANLTEKVKREQLYPTMGLQALSTSGLVDSLVGNAVVTEALNDVLDELGISLTDFNHIVESSTGMSGASLGIIYGLLELKVLNDLKAQLQVAKEKLQKYIDEGQESQPTNFNENISKMRKDVKDLEKKISEKAISVVHNTCEGMLRVDEHLMTQIAPYLKIAGASVDVFTSISSTVGATVSGSVAIYNISQICKEISEVESKMNTIEEHTTLLEWKKEQMKEKSKTGELKEELEKGIKEEPEKGLKEEGIGGDVTHYIDEHYIDEITTPLLAALKLKHSYLEHKAIDDLVGRFAKEILSLLNSVHGVTTAILILVGLKAISSAVLGPMGIPLVLAGIGTGAVSFYSTNKIDVLKFFSGIPLDAKRMSIELEENKYLGKYTSKHKEAVQEVVNMAQNIDNLKKRIEVFYQSRDQLTGLTEEDFEKMALQYNQQLSGFFGMLKRRSPNYYKNMRDEFLVRWNNAEPNYKILGDEVVILEKKLVESIETLKTATSKLKKAKEKFDQNPATKELRERREAFDEQHRLHLEKWGERAEIFRFGDDKEAYRELKESYAEAMADKDSEQYKLMKGYFYNYAKEYYPLFETDPVKAILDYFWSAK